MKEGYPPPTRFKAQTWNVKGRLLDFCYCFAPWRVLTQSLLSCRSFILPIFIVMDREGFLPIPCARPYFYPSHVLCVAHAHLLRSYLSTFPKSLQVVLPIELFLLLHTRSVMTAISPIPTWLLPSLIVNTSRGQKPHPASWCFCTCWAEHVIYAHSQFQGCWLKEYLAHPSKHSSSCCFVFFYRYDQDSSWNLQTGKTSKGQESYK